MKIASYQWRKLKAAAKTRRGVMAAERKKALAAQLAASGGEPAAKAKIIIGSAE
jgi:hypothetical protein